MLQGDEHDGRQRDHPQQRIAVFRPGRKVAGPVAGIDEAHGDQQAGADVLEDVERAQHMGMGMAPEFAEYIHIVGKNKKKR